MSRQRRKTQEEMNKLPEFPMIVLATRNKHKLAELRRLLGIPTELLRSAVEYEGAPDPEETGTTFEENALIKARAISWFTGEWALADDSGLEVDALDGAPGVISARYAGNHGDDAANNRLLLNNLAAVPEEPRTAHFSCAIALVVPDGAEYIARGECSGTILYEERGSNGFGYDPLFLPDGHDKTFAELSTEVKCGFSHRAAAAIAMRQIMENIFAHSASAAINPK